MEPFDIRNDRMAELWMPLQTVALCFDGALDVLESYAKRLDESGRESEKQSWGVRLLAAIREDANNDDQTFIPTKSLIERLIAREEEPWSRWCVFRSKPATHSDVKAATHSGVKAATRSESKAATCSDVKAATFRPRSEWVAGLPPE